VQALAALGSELPPSWSGRLGPLGLPGASLVGPLLLALGAACCAYAAVARRRRPSLDLGIVLLLIALPGQIARQLDAGRDLVAVVQPSHLLDSTGAPIADAALPPGSVLARSGDRPWAGRIAVRLPDGRSGWLPVADTVP
jgi:hypothetical protein